MKWANKLPGDVRERMDAKSIAGAARQRVQASFTALAKLVTKIELGLRPSQKDEAVVERFAADMAQAMVIADLCGRMRTVTEMRLRAGHVIGEGSSGFAKLVASKTYAAVFAGVDESGPFDEVKAALPEDAPIDKGAVQGGEPTDAPARVSGWLELPFEEAVATVVEREPELANGFVEAARAYNRHGFALARATSVNLAQEVKSQIVRGLQEGKSPEKVAKEMEELDPQFDSAYMRVVAMTNFASAYTAGRERQMRAPSVAPHIVAHIFKSALLPTTRPNHKACHNFMADANDPLWNGLSPLLGYNCFCRVRPIFMFEAQQHGIVLTAAGKMPAATRPVGAEPDSNLFGQRADMRFYDSSGKAFL